MKTAHKVHYYYALLLTIFITGGTGFVAFSSGNVLFFLLVLPVPLYFVLKITKITKGLRLTQYYAFILTTIMTIMGFVGAKSAPQFFSAVLFSLLALYFWILILPKRNKKLPLVETLPEIIGIKTKKGKVTKNGQEIEGEVVSADTFGKNFDLDRRMFLKLIGSTGVTLFLFSLFTKKAEATFFGSVPGPGTLAIKDSSGVQVDPSVKQPTDGYNISQIDDSSPAYYGFVDKNGNWYIMKEDSSNNYRYTKGTSSFSTNWTGRAALSYDYFDAIF